MIETLKRICELQPHYDPTNTPEMQERGRLIRRTLTAEISQMALPLRAALGNFGEDFGVDASDGIGRKTEAPWVRFFAESMSPDARHGFYVVIHFAADGSAVFLTIGCGATKWSHGSLPALSDEKLYGKTEWARREISQAFGSLAPFLDQIDLGAKAPLPKAFEKATAVAKRLPVQNLDEEEFRALLVESAQRLRAIYEAQRLGRDLSVSEQTQLQIDQITRPVKSRPGRGGHGFRLSQDERDAIETRAMAVSRAWLEGEGYVVADTSNTESFDFAAVKGAERLKVEVKGTTAETVDSLMMSRNEVELHQKEKGNTALLIVSKIAVVSCGKTVTATGGILTPMVGWDIDLWEAVPINYQLKKKPESF